MNEILVIAPHADDEALGLGGTIARYASEGHNVSVAILTGHGEEPHPLWPRDIWDTVRAEAQKAHELLGVGRTLFRDIPAALVSDQPIYEVNKVVFDIVNEIRPDVMFIPFIFDMHRDHRDLASASAVAWRPITDAGRGIKRIYMYETLSETHWNIQPQEAGFLPNAFVDISGQWLDRKLQALACYSSQIREFPHCRSFEAVEALAKLRGSMVGIRAAEAFVLVREIL